MKEKNPEKESPKDKAKTTGVGEDHDVVGPAPAKNNDRGDSEEAREGKRRFD